MELLCPSMCASSAVQILPSSSPKCCPTHTPSSGLSQLQLFLVLVNTWDYQSLCVPIPTSSEITCPCGFVLRKPDPCKLIGSEGFFSSAPSSEGGKPRVQARKVCFPKWPSRLGCGIRGAGIQSSGLAGQRSSLLVRAVRTAVPWAGLGHKQLVFGPHWMSSLTSSNI